MELDGSLQPTVIIVPLVLPHINSNPIFAEQKKKNKKTSHKNHVLVVVTYYPFFLSFV